MKKPTRVTFLESREGMESLFTRGLRQGAAAAGWEADLVFLAEPDGTLRSDKDVRVDLLTQRPDTICFLMDAPLHLPRLWEAPSLAGVDKISLWFDDFYRSPKTLAHPEIWKDWQTNHGVRVGVWDAYWRCAWKMHTGCDVFPVRLAADPRLLTPDAEPWKLQWHDRAAFVGTIPSLASLNEASSSFSRPLQLLLDETCEMMRTAAWPIRPYELAGKAKSYLGMKYNIAIDAALKSAEVRAVWNHLLWRWGKRIARLRGLAAVAQGAPLAIMSGHGTERYAGEAELRNALPPGTDFVYADTSAVSPKMWKSLFRTGKFQIQITDPQSIEGGMPFRIFESAACGVPLLSDYRPELGEVFPGNCGVTLGMDEAGLAEGAAVLMRMPDRELRAQGREFHKRFKAAHTWEARWTEIAADRATHATTAPLAEINWKPTAQRPIETIPQAA